MAGLWGLLQFTHFIMSHTSFYRCHVMSDALFLTKTSVISCLACGISCLALHPDTLYSSVDGLTVFSLVGESGIEIIL